MNALLAIILAASPLFAPHNRLDGKTQIVTNQQESLVFKDDLTTRVDIAATNSPDGTFQDRRIQLGDGAEASGQTIIGDGTTNRLQSVALGFNAKARGATSIAIGSGEIETNGTTNAASADGSDSIAIGYKAKSAGKQSVAIGDNAKAMDATSIAIGNSANAANNNSIAIGTKTDSTNSYSVVIGHQASSSGNYSLSIGHKAQANKYNVAIGMGAVVSAKAGKSSEAAVQIGAGTNATKGTIKFLDRQLLTEETDPTVPAWAKNPTPPIMAETDPTVPSWAKSPTKPTYTAEEVGAATPQDVTNKFNEIGPVYASSNANDGRVQIGVGSSAKNYSVVVGSNSSVDDTSAVAIGRTAKTKEKYGVAIGYQPDSGLNSVSIGKSASATNESSVAIGNNAKARDVSSVAIGDGALTIDTGNDQPNVAIGRGAESRGNNAPSVAIGAGAVAKADNAVQIGAGTNTEANTVRVFDKRIASEDFVRQFACPFKVVNAKTYAGGDYLNIEMNYDDVSDIAVGDLVMLSFPVKDVNSNILVYWGDRTAMGTIFISEGIFSDYMITPPLWRVKRWEWVKDGEYGLYFYMELSFPFIDSDQNRISCHASWD